MDYDVEDDDFGGGGDFGSNHLLGLGASQSMTTQEMIDAGILSTPATMPDGSVVTSGTPGSAPFNYSVPSAPVANTWQQLAQNLATVGVNQMNSVQQQQYQLALAKINAGHGHLPAILGGGSGGGITSSAWFTPALIGVGVLGLLFVLSKRR